MCTRFAALQANVITSTEKLAAEPDPVRGPAATENECANDSADRESPTGAIRLDAAAMAENVGILPGRAGWPRPPSAARRVSRISSHKPRRLAARSSSLPPPRSGAAMAVASPTSIATSGRAAAAPRERTSRRGGANAESSTERYGLSETGSEGPAEVSYGHHRD
jgi:hypothetical protein